MRRPEDARQAALAAIVSARARTAWIAAALDDDRARRQFDPGISPIGWHLGHVAWQEECWVLRRCGGQAPIDAALDGIYDSFRSEKGSRSGRLPPLDRILGYMERVRAATLELLASAPLEGSLLGGGAVFRFLANHERQHAETMVAAMLLGGIELPLDPPLARAASQEGWSDFLPAGGCTFVLGCDDDEEGWDNERRAHEVEVAPFGIARQPVSNGAWLAFMAGGGYGDDRLWSEAGRRWRDGKRVKAPLHWRRGADGWERRTLRGWLPVDPSHPVAHVGWFEAEAFARWAGGRLPTEAEWELAAGGAGAKRRWPGGSTDGGANLDLRVGDTAPSAAVALSPVGAEEMAGNVWEWTGSHFLPWPGFEKGIYPGYSAPWFGARHRVLRGGCWITDAAMARTTFRNWFEPEVRAFPSGLRLARDQR